MLNIFIDGKRSVLKKGISFDYVAENRRFSKSDSYTLEISFPIKGCKENSEIFGMLFRKDISAEKLMFDCEIIDKDFHKRGSVIITEFSNSEVKCQFLEGRSGVTITSPISDIYINEIDIASPSTVKSDISPENAWLPSRECVALPWVNGESGNIQNKIAYSNGSYKWSDDIYGLSWMPYLTTVIKKICEVIGYSCNIGDIENDENLKYLLICNALPYAWYLPEVARALPHWTIDEFFEKLEDFLLGVFEIDHTFKSVTYMSPQSIKNDSNLVEIKSDINDFSVDVFIKDTECTAIDTANVKYKKSEHRLQKYYDCNNAVKKVIKAGMVMEFESINDLVQKIKDKFWVEESGHRNLNLHKLYYIKEDKKYFAAACFYEDPATKNRYLGLRNINEFGERHIDESAKTVELEFVPAWIDSTDLEFGLSLFNSPGSFSESSQSSSYGDIEMTPDVAPGEEGFSEVGNHRHSSTNIYDAISEDEFNVEKSEYYDRIFIGWWNGQVQFEGKNPFPNVNSVLASSINNVKRFPFSLSIADDNSPLSLYSENIDTSMRYNISFLTDKFPSPRSIFLIKGKKYVCEKLTAKMTESGMSSLVKGVFWRIKD